MKAAGLDLAKYDALIRDLESMCQHRRANPVDKSDEVYYELLLKHFRRLRDARQEGKHIAAFQTPLFASLLHAMDMVPLHLAAVPVSLARTQATYEECFSVARQLGVGGAEVCSIHRLALGAFMQGLLPHPDLIIGSRPYCDNCAGSCALMAEIYDIPYFYADRPYTYSEAAVRYFTQELEELLGVLEQITGRRRDPRRLAEAVGNSKRLIELRREIFELRKAVPFPMRNRRAMNLEVIDFHWDGCPESVAYYELVRDELKERVERGQGFIPKERFRLASIYYPPTWCWRLWDWWEREYGAVNVWELTSWTPRALEKEMDPARPLESLARRSFFGCISSDFYYPASIPIQDTLEAVRDYQVEGVVWYANVGCINSVAWAKLLKDALAEKGIPLLFLDCDYVDPTYVSEAELKDKTEAFFEMLGERKGK
ncbi:MAG: 2-hydroxyacyl-CoA dehydratase family protein [Chloroflexota bacterium]